ncbi:hypothetical protein [Oscillatoria sp. FACHB-1406]|uniref:hypothetical protein n=1 Tax=Oscillatoria sp. FACHB-1406 TaxID=2692846 RepID=UPI001687748A|nr:hypothetical protein [Oscillatoria sp. FACHB-1406]MBD2579869.1 hypothetical protein [Oscillatoria sp. FACHB-1406]
MKSSQNLLVWALLFLLLAYIGLGWYVARATAAWQFWVRAGVCSAPELEKSWICLWLDRPVFAWSALFLSIAAFLLALVHPITKLKSVFGNWLQSDTKAFLSVIVISFLVVVVLTRSDLVAEGLSLLAPGLLARLELRWAGYSDWHSFGMIIVICAVGYVAGLSLYQHYGVP